MRYWLDTEFIEDGTTIELVSIGIVSSDGRELYLENSQCDLGRANEWVQKNVFPHLSGPRKTRYDIKNEILSFIPEQSPEIWAYFAAYDWVVFCQLFGRMIDLPERFPMYCLDVKQLMYQKGRHKPLPPSSREHHALEDARWTKRMWESLQ